MAKKDDEDAVIAAQRRAARTGRSFFPAANSQVLMNAGGSSNFHALPPDQNPAYQAAIATGRPNMNAYSWITTPSGGQMRVPTGFAWQPKTGTALEGSFVNPATGPLTSQQYASNYAKGYGAPAPSFNPATGTLAASGVETPVEQLTLPQRSVLPGSNPFLEQWAANLRSQSPRLAGALSLANKTFSGLRGAFNNPAVGQYVNNVSTGQISPQQPYSPSIQSQNFYGYNPSPVPYQPRRYSDYY